VGEAEGGPRIVTVLAVNDGRVVLPLNCILLGCTPSDVLETETKDAPAESEQVNTFEVVIPSSQRDAPIVVVFVTIFGRNPRVAEPTMQVGQPIVPLVVNVPPVIGPAVATLVTVPLPLPPPLPPPRNATKLGFIAITAVPLAIADARTRTPVKPEALAVQAPTPVVDVTADPPASGVIPNAV
jgi:hypothetical protein